MRLPYSVDRPVDTCKSIPKFKHKFTLYHNVVELQETLSPIARGEEGLQVERWGWEK